MKMNLDDEIANTNDAIEKKSENQAERRSAAADAKRQWKAASDELAAQEK
jgi:hypothetical protein